jgi:hypothetical protein
MTMAEAHQASVLIACPAGAVFALMRDPARLNRWSFGTWETRVEPDGLVEGTSIFDGARTFLRIDADPERLTVDYHLGPSPRELVPRITARIVPGEHLGRDAACAILTLLAWRTAAMTDDRWHRLKVSHEFETVLIKNLLEHGRA